PICHEPVVAAVDPVVPGAAVELVVARAAIEAVVAIAAVKVVVVTRELRAIGNPLGGVNLAPAERDEHFHEAGAHGVVATVEDVIAVVAPDAVILGAAVDRVLALIASELVEGIVTDDDVVEA